MPRKGKKIIILFHENDRGRAHAYVISSLAEYWREKGLRVEYLFGVKEYMPADLVIVHVNLSVVPDEYLEFAGRYPAALNSRVKDIRKSSFSDNLVMPGSAYEGRVIVKSDLNHAGWPELRLNGALFSGRRAYRIFMRRLSHLARGISPGLSARIKTPLDYRIYDNIGSVPPGCFSSPGLVVEKFLPEKENGLYHIRYCTFLGSRMTCTRVASKEPVIKYSNSISMEIVEPHPDMARLRKKLKFDYGKFDYTVRDGKAVLLDANITIGKGGGANSAGPGAEERKRSRIYRAEGIYEYLDPGGRS